MMIVDFDRLIVAVNEAGAGVAGRSAESLVGRRFTTLLEDPADALVERDDNDRHAPAPLTAREREIVHLIALGHVSREICDMLHVAPDTVRTHVRNAMAKTGARTRAQLIAIALGDGLLEP